VSSFGKEGVSEEENAKSEGTLSAIRQRLFGAFDAKPCSTDGVTLREIENQGLGAHCKDRRNAQSNAGRRPEASTPCHGWNVCVFGSDSAAVALIRSCSAILTRGLVSKAMSIEEVKDICPWQTTAMPNASIQNPESRRGLLKHKRTFKSCDQFILDEAFALFSYSACA